MSYVLMRATWACGPDDPLLQLALLAIAGHADRSGVAKLSLSDIQTGTRLDRDTALCTLQALRTEGWFTYTAPNTFHLSLAKLHVGRPAVPAPVQHKLWTCGHCGALHSNSRKDNADG